MLHQFLTSNRIELIERCRATVAERSSPEATVDELEHGIPHFLDQLIKTLQQEQTADPAKGLKVSGPPGGSSPAQSEIGKTAAEHGRELLNSGYTVEQVVHDYGDICQAVTGLAFERSEVIEAEEFRTLNRCLDNAIAIAVTEFNYQRDSVIAGEKDDAFNKRLGVFAHELRNHLNSATLALTAIRSGDVGFNGATGAVLDRSLVGMRNLIDRSLSDVRLSAGLPVLHRLFSLKGFIAEVELAAQLEAQIRGCTLSVGDVEPGLFVDGDQDLLFSALGNLLQNAFKFTHKGTEVTLSAYASADRILIDVEDNCGGLQPGAGEKMFEPFNQMNEDRTGVGLGLSIAQRSVNANEGTLSVRDVPGSGCVFTINLPRHSGPSLQP